jgi:hypothetical protein
MPIWSAGLADAQVVVAAATVDDDRRERTAVEAEVGCPVLADVHQ